MLAYKIKCSEGSGPRQVKVMLPGQLLVVNENDNLWKYIKYTLHGICKEGPDIVCSMKTSSNYPSMAAVYGEKNFYALQIEEVRLFLYLVHKQCNLFLNISVIVNGRGICI